MKGAAAALAALLLLASSPASPSATSGGSQGATLGGGGGGSILSAALAVRTVSAEDAAEPLLVAGCPPPCHVQFDATATTAVGYSIQQLAFEWDFDDAAAGWVPRGGRQVSLDTAASSPLAGHSYYPTSFPDSCSGSPCKRYVPKVTVRVRDGGAIVAEVKSATIEVIDPSAEFPTTDTTCIHDGTVGSGCPAGAVTTTTVAFSDCQSGKQRILLKRGASFTFSGTQTLGSFSCLVDAYGSGAVPNLTLSATGSGDVFTLNGTGAGVRFANLRFIGAGNARRIWGGTRGLGVHDVEVSTTPGQEFSNYWNFADSAGPILENQRLYFYKFRGRRVGVVGTTAAMGFFSAQDFFVVASEVGGAQGDVEHNIRVSQGARFVLDANEYFDNQCPGGSGNKEMVGIRNGSSTPSEFNPTQWFAVTRSHFEADCLWGLYLGQGNSPGNVGRIEDGWVLENSAAPTFSGARAAFKAEAGEAAGGYTRRIVASTNYYEATGTLSGSANDVRMWESEASGGATFADNRMLHSAIVQRDAHTGQTSIAESMAVVECANNVIYDPSSTKDPCQGTTVDDSAGNHLTTTDPFDANAGEPSPVLDLDDLQVTLHSPLASAGVAAHPPYRDAFGWECPSGAFDSGVHCVSQGASAAVSAQFTCRSFGQEATATEATPGTLNVKYGAPLICWATSSSVNGTDVNGAGWVPRVTFEWDWDDDSLGTSVVGGWDLGRGVGLVAAHAFAPSAFDDSCNGGTNSLHAVRLIVASVVDGAQVADSAVMNVCVEARATTWPTPVAYCDDANCADDPGVPPGTVHGGNGTDLATILAHCATNGSEYVVLEGGVTFSTASLGNGLANAPCVFESYGTGRAKLKFTGTGINGAINANRLSTDGAGVGTTFIDVEFAGVGAVNPYLFTTSSDRGRLAVVDSAVSTTVGEEFGRMLSMGALNGEALANELYWFKFDVTTTVTTAEPVYYLFGTHVAFVGGRITGTSNTADRHLIRLPQWRRAVIDAMYLRDQGLDVPVLSIRQKCGGSSSCPQYASADTLAVTRVQSISNVADPETLELCASGQGTPQPTKCYDVDVVDCTFSYEGTWTSDPKNHVEIKIEVAPGETRRVRFVRTAFDQSECGSSSTGGCAAVQGGAQDVAFLNSVLVYAGSHTQEARLWGGSGVSVAEGNVGVRTTGSMNLFPNFAEDATNLVFTSDVFDRDGDGIAIKENFGRAELRILHTNASLGGAGAVPAFLRDDEGDLCYAPHDAGIDCE